MSGERIVLLTSAGSGVGSAVQEAAAVSPSEYRIVGTSSVFAAMRTGERALRCPVTAQREAFQKNILRLAVSLGNCLVVPGRDEDADALGEIAPSLAAHGAALASGPAWAVSAAYDKAATPCLLASSRLPVAVAADNLTDALDVASTHGWPLVVKPRRGNSSREIRIVKSATELRACFRQGTDIAQEFLSVGPQDRRSWDGRFHGGQYGEYSLQMLLDGESEEIGHFCSRNILADGVPRLVETIDGAQVSDLIGQARDAFCSLQCWGAWNFQGRRGPDGTIRIFEVNARPTGITGLRARLGFNELDLLYESLLLRRVPKRPEPPLAGMLIDTISGDEWGPVSTSQRLVLGQ
jgi:hypothetical protein